MTNVRKYKNIILVTREIRRNYLVSELNYHTTIEIRKTQMLMNKPIYLGLSIFDPSNSVKYEFCYNYVKPKYGEDFVLWIQKALSLM